MGVVTSPFDTAEMSTALAADRLSLVNGRTFVVASADGALRRPSDGAVFEDLRMLSRLTFDVVGAAGTIRRQALGVASMTPFQAAVVSRPDPEITAGEPAEFYVHRQWVGRGVRHDFEIHNPGHGVLRRTVRLHADTDFAHLFDMKAGRSGAASAMEWNTETGRLFDPGDTARSVTIRALPPPTAVEVASKSVQWDVECRSDESVTVSVTFEPWWDGLAAGLSFPVGTPAAESLPSRSLEEWQRDAPTILSDDPRLAIAVETTVADLASLRIFDPNHSERVVIAAGAPWFMTLFGRDSLLTSWMVMPFLPELAIGTLDSLAELQGTSDRAETEEQPGKILHELRRHGGDAAFAHRGRYYGTVDATALFVMVAAEAFRWGHLDGAALQHRWPAIQAALEWVRRRIETDPGGFLRYQRSTEVGLANQGWKDSWDGISFADGRLPTGAIALAEVQGYAYAALTGAADLARHLDDPDVDPEQLLREADQLAERYENGFWDERSSSYAVALDGDGNRIDSVTTNPGHAIWTGITTSSRANRYLDRILDSDLFSGWGLRTLSPTCQRYDPLSYHNGSVWPHDTAIVAAGAARIGRRDVVDTLVDAALDAAALFSGRPPELFSGIARSLIGVPVSYPSSCSPQAWASASTLLHIRSALDLAPPTGAGPPSVATTSSLSTSLLTGVRARDQRFQIAVDEAGLRVIPSTAHPA